MGNYHFKNEDNNNCKLTNDQVKQIKVLAACQTKTYRQIAKLYNVSHAHVYKIVHDKTRQSV
jgi:Mor family transcriptional regulator